MFILQRYSLMPVRCGPVVDAGSRDKPFLPDMPRSLILNKAYKPIPMVSGVTLNEGLLFYLCKDTVIVIVLPSNLNETF